MQITETENMSIEIDNSPHSNEVLRADNVENSGNAGWADSIAKILQTSKPKSKKSLVLSRAKNLNKSPNEIKLDEIVSQPNYGFEIEGELKKPEIKLELEYLNKIKREKNKNLNLRIKPILQDRERERVLKRIATRGVVQLFNAVRMQQKDLTTELEKAGPLDSRKDAVLQNINKKKFLDVLMSGERSKSKLIDKPVKNEYSDEENESDGDEIIKKKKSEWSVLQDNFMISKTFKNWDEENSDEDEKADNYNNETSDSD